MASMIQSVGYAVNVQKDCKSAFTLHKVSNCLLMACAYNCVILTVNILAERFKRSIKSSYGSSTNDLSAIRLLGCKEFTLFFW